MLRLRFWMLHILLLASMLVPIWISTYPPLYDYTNHLLEAQVVAHYHDPQWHYAEGYVIRPGWYLRSNALATIFLIGLGSLMAMNLAGQLLASLYLMLFWGGMWLFLRETARVWPLFLLTPVLAYNFGFTSGWLNFSLGVAIGLFALVAYLRWQAEQRHRYLALLAILLLLLYMAHLLAWILTILVIASFAAVDTLRLRSYGSLLVAINSALPLLLVTRPKLGIIAILVAPIFWCSAVMIRRLPFMPRYRAQAILAMLVVAVVSIRALKPLIQSLLPDIDYYWFNKIVTPFQLFTLPHQFVPPDPLLTMYNGLLCLLIVLLGGLLMWSTVRLSQLIIPRILAAIAVLSIVYVLIPSATGDIKVVEPRPLLFIVVIALAGVQLPVQGSYTRRLITTCVITLCLLSISGTILYAQLYARQASGWSNQINTLAPLRRVLVLKGIKPESYAPALLRTFNVMYGGNHFSTTYTLEHGGFVSSVFMNGPVVRRSGISVPAYYLSDFNALDYIQEQCSHLGTAYGAVLVWGTSNAELNTQVDACLGTGIRLEDMVIWRVR